MTEITDDEFMARVREADLCRLDRAAKELERDGWVDPWWIDIYCREHRDVRRGEPVPPAVVENIARVERKNAGWIARYYDMLIRTGACTALVASLALLTSCTVYEREPLDQGTQPYFDDPACAGAEQGTWCNPIEVTPRCEVAVDFVRDASVVSGDCDGGEL